ncbi:hypothetical protein CRYUN_Cryun33cG0038400 [Craigia yunnanensis]
MGFVFGLVIGLVVGLAIIVLFVRSENSRSKLRNDLATTVAAFARMTVEDSRKILPAQFYPSWVVFSQRQKLTWLNQHLTKIWPHVNEAASDLIKISVEPVLEQYRLIILSSLKFSKFTLGTVAPQFTGVSIVEDGADSVTMEMEMQWDANSSIILDIKTYLGVSLPCRVVKDVLYLLALVLFNVNDIGFTGVFRLIFKPLVNEFPCFGAVCFSLRKKKKLDFTLKVIGGDISTIPGLSDAIESTIRDAIEDSIMWPVRKIIPILPGDYSDLELKPVGILEVKLVQAWDLTNKDIIGKSDPYAVLYVRPLPDKTKKSKTIMKFSYFFPEQWLNPIWNEHYEFVIEDATTQHLVVRIYDDEGVQASELIGCAQVQLRELEPGKVKDVWLNLVKDLEIQRDTKYRGQWSKWNRVIENEKAVTQKKKEAIIRGVLSVTVICADNLPVVDLMGKADPYVVLTLKKSEARNKTRVVNDSLNPVWNQTFDFVVEDGLHDMLIL